MFLRSGEPMNTYDDRTASKVVLRHRWPVRVLHWINALAVIVLLLSGLQIFNAHPRLYWGRQSYDGREPVLSLDARMQQGKPAGITRIGSHEFETTGVLGASRGENGEWMARGFPAWATLPSSQWLAMGRRWHLFFAWILVVNGAAYLLHAIATGRFRRELWPTRADLRALPRSIVEHLRMHRASGDEALRYNVLQRLAYVAVIALLLPFTILMGLGLSPAVDALWPGWVDAFGGRQSIRTLHFLCATALSLFILIHLFEVIVNGPLNELRSMITGRFRVRSAK
jgi:thiosulfate reductase cytochrome b subunit